jgi:hypothetical protein
MNITSYPGLLHYENTSLNGMLGGGILFAFFLIIMLSLSYLIDLVNGVMIAGFVCLGLSLILALPGIAIVGPNIIYLFIGITGIAVLGNLLRGVTSTW